MCIRVRRVLTVSGERGWGCPIRTCRCLHKASFSRLSHKLICVWARAAGALQCRVRACHPLRLIAPSSYFIVFYTFYYCYYIRAYNIIWPRATSSPEVRITCIIIIITTRPRGGEGDLFSRFLVPLYVYNTIYVCVCVCVRRNRIIRVFR